MVELNKFVLPSFCNVRHTGHDTQPYMKRTTEAVSEKMELRQFT